MLSVRVSPVPSKPAMPSVPDKRLRPSELLPLLSTVALAQYAGRPQLGG